jgi:hypothetical protein
MKHGVYDGEGTAACRTGADDRAHASRTLLARSRCDGWNSDLSLNRSPMTPRKDSVSIRLEVEEWLVKRESAPVRPLRGVGYLPFPESSVSLLSQGARVFSR